MTSMALDCSDRICTAVMTILASRHVVGICAWFGCWAYFKILIPLLAGQSKLGKSFNLPHSLSFFSFF